MGIKSICATFLLLFCSQSFAEGTSPVPDKLFGVPLGGIYDIGTPELVGIGNLPIKKFTGAQKFLGEGLHYYFEPKEAYKAFNYVERPEKQGEQYFPTSFRLYLLPVIPNTITNIEQFEKATLKWEVSVIEWSGEATKDDHKAKDEAYYWAIDICKTFESDISVKPEIYNNFEDKLYSCTFSSGDRKLVVGSLSAKYFQLSYAGNIFNKKTDNVDNTIRKLRAKNIKPY